MPEGVEEHVKQQQAELETLGYTAMRNALDQSLTEAPADPAPRRQFVKETAIEASQAVAELRAPIGYGGYAGLLAFETGERRAIRDWSNEHNHALGMAVEAAHPAVVQQEISVSEVGLSGHTNQSVRQLRGATVPSAFRSQVRELGTTSRAAKATGLGVVVMRPGASLSRVVGLGRSGRLRRPNNEGRKGHPLCVRHLSAR